MRSKTADGAKLRSAREDAELTQVQVAAILTATLGRRVAHETISRIERGHRQPSAKLFGALARVYQVNKADLLKDEEVAA